MVGPIQPRSFGFYIGDKLTRAIELELHDPNKLNLNSIPTKGRISPWLSLDSIGVERQQSVTSFTYEIKLNYQIVNVSPDIEEVIIPRFFLSYGTSKESSRLLVPETKVSVSSLIEGQQQILQPDQKPVKLPQNYLKSVLAGIFLSVSLIGLVLVYRGFSFSRKTFPFAVAYKKLKKHNISVTENNYRDALKIIHQAFNETAGKTVFFEQLDVFFNENENYIPMRIQIEKYYKHSRKYFFERSKSVADHQFSIMELIRFTKDCQNIERGFLKC